jgi:hypothetical protein
MEYEIGDDPQGLPEIPDGDRDGGLREEWFLMRPGRQRPSADGRGDAWDEDAMVRHLGIRQFGEVA